jgi:hypothetical protein
VTSEDKEYPDTEKQKESKTEKKLPHRWQPGEKPPGSVQWQPGQSGNPKGRPPGFKKLGESLKEELDKPCPADKQGRTWREVILLTTLSNAAQGKPVPLSEIWNRADGKATQSLEVKGDVDINGNIEQELAAKLDAIANRRKAQGDSE